MDNSPPIRAAVDALIERIDAAEDKGAMAKACGLGRTSLYAATRPGWNPTLSTLLLVERYLMGDMEDSAEQGHAGNTGGRVSQQGGGAEE